VGPHLPLDIHFAIGNFIRDAMNGGPIRIRGDGTAVRSYMYMADLAIWLWTLALHSTATGAYNVGSEQAVSILDTARGVAAVCYPGVPIEVEGKPTPGSLVHRYVPSTARAQRQLGVGQTVELADGIRRTAEWHAASQTASPRT
jgi:dTDP-glucose 4,6-dehydratase